MAAKKKYATYNKPDIEIKNGRFVHIRKQVRVEVMAEASGYAMVRFPRCIPFVASLKDIEKDHP